MSASNTYLHMHTHYNAWRLMSMHLLSELIADFIVEPCKLCFDFQRIRSPFHRQHISNKLWAVQYKSTLHHGTWSSTLLTTCQSGSKAIKVCSLDFRFTSSVATRECCWSNKYSYPSHFSLFWFLLPFKTCSDLPSFIQACLTEDKHIFLLPESSNKSIPISLGRRRSPDPYIPVTASLLCSPLLMEWHSIGMRDYSTVP